MLKNGQRVRVIKNIYAHGFDIGEEVLILSKYPPGQFNVPADVYEATRIYSSRYRCNRWNIVEEEVEIIEWWRE